MQTKRKYELKKRADDMAKTAGLRIGPLHHWRPTLDEVARRFGIMRG